MRYVRSDAAIALTMSAVKRLGFRSTSATSVEVPMNGQEKISVNG
ncbi:hypothetical protein HanRHA438_Chr04g0165221 [Helianthus annuus]|uniref:Uncharacterized protein n=1 Tax=Helianthus annuus TaxID=4232 RepID=A0A9K3NQN3_HELAN|nr:hypothetical protein HanXRQr2_Chr04g0155031 [Helianthus annuus]KAJ0925923.1 hypothetical protein HanRHA438_Chr04g0165221 [Helianthus annuus]KAJ0930414.1 hypothetical protein HanPSC8_Chr04g0149081 [Helianthus annuus]